ncbi:MAG: histidine kinase dimerization/phosphoacceptor domain -containing protein [Treponemataceae bacterium]
MLRETSIAAAGPGKIRTVPDFWEGADAAGKDGQGSGTYRLRILLPHTRPKLDIRYTTASTAFEMDINGIQLANAGKPAVDPGQALPGCRPGVIIVYDQSDELTLVVRISNHEYRNGGMWRAFQLGERQEIENAKMKDTVISIILFAFFTAIAFNSATVYLFRKKERSQLYFAFFTLILALRPLVTGDYPLVEALPQLPFTALIRLVYLTSFLPIPLALLFASHLFPDLLSLKLKRWLVLPTVPFIPFAIVAPLPILTRIIFVFYGVAFLSFAGLYFGVLIRAVVLKRPGALAFSLSGAVIILTGINDVLYASFVINTGYFLPYGLAAMVMVQATVLSRRFTQAFDMVEELAEKISHANKDLETEIEHRKVIQSELEDSLIEKNDLLKNVHHWVRNSLQMVSSLISLEANRTKDSLQVERYATIKTRIQSISLVHDQLYQSGSTDRLELRSFVHELLDVLITCYGKEYDCDLKIDIHSVYVPAKVCVDFGLILTELISNSFKFAILPRGIGQIRIDVIHEGNELILNFADDGPGFPSDFTPEKPLSMGYRMLMRIVASYSGTCKIIPEESAHVEIRLRLPVVP